MLEDSADLIFVERKTEYAFEQQYIMHQHSQSEQIFLLSEKASARRIDDMPPKMVGKVADISGPHQGNLEVNLQNEGIM